MALINCPECGKQVSDRAASCPDCGCPISVGHISAEEAVLKKGTSHTPKKKRTTVVIVIVAALLLVVAAVVYLYITEYSPAAKQFKAFTEAVTLYQEGSYEEALAHFETMDGYENSAEIANWCRYELGKSAMKDFDWKTAAEYLSGLSYADSDAMLVDCSFMLSLEESVLRRMEITAKENNDYRSLVTTELAYLEEYRSATFYDEQIKKQAEKYLNGLDKQLSSLTYDYYYEYQDGWNSGLVARYTALDYLYDNYSFMANNPNFVGEYIKQLPYHQKWLTAFKSLEATGFVEKDWKWEKNYCEMYFKNSTPYTFTPVFEIVFSGDEEGRIHLGTTTVVVENVGPFAEYSVRAYYTPEAKDAYYSSGLWVSWSSYYDEIKVD